MNICAPGRYNIQFDTCFSMQQLMEMAKAYNRFITTNKSNDDNQILIKIKKDAGYLLAELRKRFENVCQKDDFCLSKQKFINGLTNEMKLDIKNNTFRTEGPNDPMEWLTTTHIDKLMKQYEEIYPDFIFEGAVPLNCNDVSFCSLFGLNFDELLAKGKNKIGIVFNHDKYGSPGSHWVALFIDSKKGEINFCDSSGNKPIENINTIIDQFLQWFKKKYGKNAIYKENKKRYQMDASECGVYSCNFIIQKLAGIPFDDIVKDPLNFKQINSCRNVYFNNRPSKFEANPKCDPHQMQLLGKKVK